MVSLGWRVPGLVNRVLYRERLLAEADTYELQEELEAEAESQTPVDVLLLA